MYAPRYLLSQAGLSVDQFKKALAAAQEAFIAAYQPYSKFQVGCGILSGDGSISKGCNVETANYDGSHAEEVALGAMVVNRRRDPMLCVCWAGLEGPEGVIVASCGKCRQALYEFASLQGTELWLAMNPVPGSSWPVGEPCLAKLTELLVEPFGPADIGVDLVRYRRAPR